MPDHLVFYDGNCGFCDRVVQFLMKADKKKRFAFAPFRGEMAKKRLVRLPERVRQADSVILIENYKKEGGKTFIYGKASFRILWHLGGFWKLIGWVGFLPAFLYDWGYRLVAKSRSRSCVAVQRGDPDRFLD